MSKRTVFVQVLGLAASTATGALAQEAPAASASGSASLSTSSGADATAATSAAPPPAVAPPTPPPPPPQAPFEPYEPGLPPEGNVLELGGFGGLLIPSNVHDIRARDYAQKPYEVGAEGGVRLGYYPLSFLGIEGEAMGAGSKVKGTPNQAVFYGYRGFLVLQAPTAWISPFLVGGYGRLGAVSHAMGNDVDQGWMFGAGAKIPVTHILGVRLDFRDNLTPNDHVGNGQAHNFEVLLGLSATIERSRKEPPPPPPDSDHDGIADSADKCPNDAGPGPDGCPPDTDGDGVLDRDDYCPREAGPAPKGCPIIDPDPDKDGVPIPCDACPNEPGVPPDGCPIRDKDGDGIPDNVDKCPNEPETKNGFEDEDGCPDKIPDAVKKFSGVVQGIYFKQGSAVIRPDSKPVLNQAVRVLQEYPSISFEIDGHTS
ncbi:MAG TPA: thrombospondin type 3 repeat-containing protein, partial [Polyangiaceae bacterium]|nr:thrombospondin type 3 repeat-containing protein [Polyangiaceae bacterium]